MKFASKNTAWFYFLLLFLCSDTLFSYFKHYNKKLDGDIVNVVLPIDTYSKVLHDPFAIQATVHHQRYSGTNRWLSHVTMRFLFSEVYRAVTLFARDKVTSLYITAAIGFLVSQFLLLISIALYAYKEERFSLRKFLPVLLLIVPFFHAKAFAGHLVLIDYSITYTIFYAFPLSLLLLFFYPFYRYVLYDDIRFFSSRLLLFSWYILACGIAFSSALNPVLGFIFGIIIVSYSFKPRITHNLPRYIRRMRILLILFVMLCIYSYYAGTFNSENTNEFSLAQRYSIFFKAFPAYFTNTGFLVLFFYIACGIVLLRKRRSTAPERKQFMLQLILSGILLLYVLLLPFGGYRSYRPNILRGDVTMPLTVSLITLSSFLCLILVSKLRGRMKSIFIFLTAAYLSVFYFQDIYIHHDHTLEKKYLVIISNNKARDLVLPSNTSILSWKNVEVEDQYHNIALMLYKWGITDSVRPYRQE